MKKGPPRRFKSWPRFEVIGIVGLMRIFARRLLCRVSLPRSNFIAFMQFQTSQGLLNENLK